MHRYFRSKSAWCCALAALAAIGGGEAAALGIVTGPYLNMPATTSMVVRFETDQPATGEVGWGNAIASLAWTTGKADAQYHEITLDALKPNSYYFYQVRAKAADGTVVESTIYTFQTAVTEDTPFAFAVLCDTQSNPEVVNKIAELAWSQRPHFTLLGGDLVSKGGVKEHWTEHFFPNMHPLNSRVPLVPALGNHEDDAQYYYDYFTLPAPEYYYRLPYGNLELFIVDSQRSLMPGSEQYTWLDGALGDSKALWKIVCLHKPPYSSDEDDYGDTNEVMPFGGDIAQRPVIVLYEKHKVDIVWSGHIHSYERTHPLLGGKAVAEGGVLYMVTGGAGGNLETAGPWRLPFSARVRRGHHYSLVTVNGPTLRIDVFDLDGQRFDHVELKK